MTTQKKSWIVGGLHAENGTGREKWREIETFLEDINLEYSYPKIIHIDINADIKG